MTLSVALLFSYKSFLRLILSENMSVSMSCLRVLITGGLGFLGLSVARQFKSSGAYVVGIGHGGTDATSSLLYDRWLQSDISQQALEILNEKFDVVIHLAGSNSVAFSIKHPLVDFQKTVTCTTELLEYLRRHNPEATLIYASSAAVYGSAPDCPLLISAPPNPVSPYGFNKVITESLLLSYYKVFGQRCKIVRFFSIYGPGLRRQLLWDAANKLTSEAQSSMFWGSGNETRDWIHVDDAARLLVKLAEHPQDINLINGGNGVRISISETIHQLRNELGCNSKIEFNCIVKHGDPLFYLADMSEAQRIGWKPLISFKVGIQAYARWYIEAKAAGIINIK